MAERAALAALVHEARCYPLPALPVSAAMFAETLRCLRLRLIAEP